jgi:type I restriction enzyme M protein
VDRAILAALSERDPEANICTDAKGNPEPDPELRDTETVPLPKKSPLPLPIGYKGADGKEPANDKLVTLVRAHCNEYFAREVTPHWPDAWIDYSKTKIGYEIPISQYFYVYEPPRPIEKIEADIKALEGEIVALLGQAA